MSGHVLDFDSDIDLDLQKNREYQRNYEIRIKILQFCDSPLQMHASARSWIERTELIR